MNLEELITQAYTKHQAKLQSEQEEKQRREQKEIKKAIARFRIEFDKVIPLELQEALGIQFSATQQSVVGEFNYSNESLQIAVWGNGWGLLKSCGGHLCDGNAELFLDKLLIELGKIREANPVDSAKIAEFQGVFNQCYVLIEKIAQSDEWRWLCDRFNAKPEMKTSLGDVLHYLSEAMECADEA